MVMLIGVHSRMPHGTCVMLPPRVALHASEMGSAAVIAASVGNPTLPLADIRSGSEIISAGWPAYVDKFTSECAAVFSIRVNWTIAVL